MDEYVRRFGPWANQGALMLTAFLKQMRLRLLNRVRLGSPGCVFFSQMSVDGSSDKMSKRLVKNLANNNSTKKLKEPLRSIMYATASV